MVSEGVVSALETSDVAVLGARVGFIYRIPLHPLIFINILVGCEINLSPLKK